MRQMIVPTCDRYPQMKFNVSASRLPAQKKAAPSLKDAALNTTESYTPLFHLKACFRCQNWVTFHT
jgi:hypothetical protein